MHLAEGVKESFGKIRFGQDGQIDLSTVDGRVRSMAMIVAVMHDREDTKSAASLADIQHAYFDRITPMFEEVHQMMLTAGGHPQSVSWALSRDMENVIEIFHSLSHSSMIFSSSGRSLLSQCAIIFNI